MKHDIKIDKMDGMESPPAWGRGLKPATYASCHSLAVAPRVGAWIETAGIYTARSGQPVAPRVGAWIETNTIDVTADYVSRPPRGGVD